MDGRIIGHLNALGHIMKLILAAIVLASLTSARADEVTVGLHLVSHHFPAKEYQNNVNLGIYARYDNVVVGTYRNTLSRQSVYAAYAFDYGPFTLMVGAVTGYKSHVVSETTSCRQDDMGPMNETGCTTAQTRLGFKYAVAPMLSPSVRLPEILGLTPRLSYMPGFGVASSVLHLSIERSL